MSRPFTNGQTLFGPDLESAFVDIESRIPLAEYFAQDLATTSGTTFGYKAGVVESDTTSTPVAAGTLALTPSAVNYIQVSPSTGVVNAQTVGWTSGLRKLYKATVGLSSITSVVDARTWASNVGAGGAGSNTNKGTWANSTAYSAGDLVQNNSPVSTYLCTADNTSDLTTQPGVGADWATVWKMYAERGGTGPAGDDGTDGAGYGGTSTTSLAIATGSKTFTTQAGLAYTPGSLVRASSAADGTNFMQGTVTSYSGTSLVLNVNLIGGSGTKTDWGFSVGALPGTTGTGWPDAFKGAWDIGTAYLIGDIVTNGGGAYIANADNTGHAPPNVTYWDVFVLPGAPGLDGTQPGDQHTWTKLQSFEGVALPNGASITLAADEPALDPTLGGTQPFASRVSIKQASAAHAIFGIADPDAAQLLVILNESGFNLTIAHDSGLATAAANHIMLAKGADFVLAPRQSIVLLFDHVSFSSGSSVTQRWVEVGTCSAAGVGAGDFKADGSVPMTGALQTTDIAEPGTTTRKLYSVATGLLKWAGKFVALFAGARPTAITILGADTSGNLVPVALSGLTYDGTTLTASGGGGDFLADGSVPATGAFDMGGNAITDLLTGSPLDGGTNAATQQYVDDAVTAGGGSGGATAFTGLTDVPASYTGQAGKLAQVNATEDGLQFVSIVTAGDDVLVAGGEVVYA